MTSSHKETKGLLNMQMVVVWLMNIGYYNYKFYLTFNLMQDWEESCIIAWFWIGTAEICPCSLIAFIIIEILTIGLLFAMAPYATLYIYFSTIIIRVFAPGK